ncbi:PREDICTED: uncharacterized protein LOC106806679 [Priapulus caudatus]|uniref:Uncharacterized protein LOC106806679 n=1 Tax=Priapulus caudatus TaxID=37621 RepID=A0ABM1DW56_PRICU|nr:PREDICTED: uncharacterized protein LOC106806679 [Priapulus caudatus]
MVLVMRRPGSEQPESDRLSAVNAQCPKHLQNDACKHDYGANTKTRVKLQGTRKLDCPAAIQIRQVTTYPDFGATTALCNTPNSPYNAKRKRFDGEMKKRFLLVHQEPWKQRLLMRYGKEMVFMDATYKTTKYALPLFFLCVHTNVGYKVVAEFMCQYEDSISIAEALSVLQSWNPEWRPKFFMTDYSTCEIDAIEARFPGVLAYICDFHRLQAWNRWLRKRKNGLNSKEQQELLCHMKKVAGSKNSGGV